MSIATMKNIFKMMLVAVAAIGITSCSTEQEQFVVDSVGTTTVFEISMSFDETRSQFNGLNDAGTAYTSVFGGYEKFNYTMRSTDGVYSSQGNIEPNAEFTGSLIRPTITINGASSNYTGGTFRICSPASSALATYNGFTIAVPTKQVPLADSCDPAAHIVYGECTMDGSTNLPVLMEHYAAYGCMTLNRMDERLAEGERIRNVIITINSHNYTLDPSNVVDNVFWFACEAEKPTSMKVTVNTYADGDEEGTTYAKTFDLTKNGGSFTFNKGEVAKFKVNMMGADVEVSEAPVVVADYLFTDIYYTTRYNGGFYLYNDNNEYLVIKLNADDFDTGTEYEADGSYLNYYTHNSIKTGEYSWSESGTPASGYFRINRYMFDGNEVTSYGEIVNTETTKLTVELDENGRYVIKLFFELGYSADFKITYDIGYSEVVDEQLDPMKDALATPAPAVEIDGTSATISWAAIDNADSYYVWCSNGVVDSEYKATSITLDGLTEGAHYKVTVRALPEEGSFLYKESAEGAIEFDVPYGEAVKLDTPAITGTEVTDSTITVNWNAVTNATNYVVTCGDKSETVANTVTTYTFEGLDAETEYTISVVAKGDGLQYTDSDAATTTATTDVASGGGESGGTVDMSGAKVTVTGFSVGSLKFNLVKDSVTIACDIKYSGYALPSTVTVVAGTPSEAGQCGITIGGTVPTSISGTIDIPSVAIFAPYIYGNAFILNFVADGTTYTGQSETVQLN